MHVGALVAKNIKPREPFVITGKDGKQYSFKIEKDSKRARE